MSLHEELVFKGAQTIEAVVASGDIKKAHLTWNSVSVLTRRRQDSVAFSTIPTEVVLHSLEHMGIWCGYLHLTRDFFWSFGLDGKIIYYKLLLEAVKGEYPDTFYLHGGCTYLEIVDKYGTLKIGCDFAHYNDMDKLYGLVDVLSEMQLSVESLEKLLLADPVEISKIGFIRKSRIIFWKIKELLILRIKLLLVSIKKDLKNIVSISWEK